MKLKIKCFNFLFLAIIILSLLMHGCISQEQEVTDLPVVITDEIGSISSTLAIITGTVISTGGSSWVDRGICYSNIITEPVLSDEYIWAEGGSHSGTFSVLLENLTPGTKYYIRAYALSTVGASYGNMLEFSTTDSITGNIVFNQNLTYGTVNDIDGNTYKTIMIGTRNWMAENLRTTKYNDGSDIPLVEGTSEWIDMNTPGYCWYLNNEGKYKKIYGALYNWYTVNTGILCPQDWHVPDDSEWETLVTDAGGSVAGNYLKESDLTHWVITTSDVTNSSGFTALPGGNRYGVYTNPIKYFSYMGYSGYFWSSSEYADTDTTFNGAYSRTAGCDLEKFVQSTFSKSQGLSVRCVHD